MWAVLGVVCCECVLGVGVECCVVANTRDGTGIAWQRPAMGVV